MTPEGGLWPNSAYCGGNRRQEIEMDINLNCIYCTGNGNGKGVKNNPYVTQMRQCSSRFLSLGMESGNSGIT